MNYKEVHDQEQEAIRQDARRIADKAELYDLYRRRRDIIPCEANSSLLLKFFAGVPLDQEKLDEALSNPDFFSTLATHPSDETLRARLIKEIEEMLQGSPQAVAHVVASLKYKTTDEIAEQRDELKRRKEVRELPKEELKVMARGAEASQFMEVPAIYRTRSMLLDLANTDVKGFRSLVKKCGEQQINKILAGKS